METSAKDGTNVEEAFDVVVKSVLERMVAKHQVQQAPSQNSESTLSLGPSPNGKKKKGCIVC